MSTEDIKKKFRREVISGISLLIIGIVLIVAGVIILRDPHTHFGMLGEIAAYIGGGILFLLIAICLLGHSALIKQKPVRKAREEKLKELGVHIKMLESQKKSGIALMVSGTVLILVGIVITIMGAIILYTMDPSAGALYFLGFLPYFIGVILVCLSASKLGNKRMKDLASYTEMLGLEKIFGITFFGVGIVFILLGTIILYTLEAVWMLSLIFLGVPLVCCVGAGLWIHSVNKEKLKELEES